MELQDRVVLVTGGAKATRLPAAAWSELPERGELKNMEGSVGHCQRKLA